MDNVNLGDYVGKLLSEISKARVQADIEAVRIAELYARDPLLKNFPIPRVRLPKVEINAPVVITEVQEAGGTHKRIDAKKLTALSQTAILKTLKTRNINLTNTEVQIVNRRLNAGITRIEPSLEADLSTESMAKNISGESINSLKSIRKVKVKLNPQEFKEVSLEISHEIKMEMAKLQQPEEARVKISALTTDIKQINDNQKITFLKLSIAEEGVEWTKISDDDTEENILVPE